MATFHSRVIAGLAAGWMVAIMMSRLLHAREFSPDLHRGKTVYERHCLGCHGVAGYGDGPDSASLKVPPASFHRYSSFFKSDEDMLRTIEHGIVFSPMHAWQGRLSEGEMQDVVAYIRILFQQGR